MNFSQTLYAKDIAYNTGLFHQHHLVLVESVYYRSIYLIIQKGHVQRQQILDLGHLPQMFRYYQTLVVLRSIFQFGVQKLLELASGLGNSNHS